MPMIEVCEVTKEYRLGQMQGLRRTITNSLSRVVGKAIEIQPPFKAIDNVSFTIEQGEVLGLIGHNGAGKSTMLKLLSQITVPTKGAIKIRGKIAPLIEVGAGFVGDLTGRENIFLNAAILGVSRSEIKKRVDEIIEFAELEDFIDTPVKRYSSGMSVRLGFSIATSVSAEIIVVDEVLAVGDLAFQQKCIDRMESLIKADGRTVIIVGHNIRQLERICTRAVLLDHGKVSADGNPSEVCARFFKEAQQRTFDRHSAASAGLVPQQSSGVIEVTRLVLLDENRREVAGTGLHDPITVRVDFECKKRISGVEVVVGVHTADFVHVLSVSNAMNGDRPDLNAGCHSLECRLSDIPLRPFTYSIRLAFLDGFRQLLWYADNLIPFVVDAGKFDVTKLPEAGIVDVPATWAFDS